MKAIPRLLLPVVALLAVSCAGSKKTTAASGAPTGGKEKSFDSWATGMSGGGGYTQDGEGHWSTKEGSKRSSFESKGTSPYFKGEFAGTKKEFKTGDYQKKSWWGNKDYEMKEYTGNTDGSKFQKSSRFGEVAARDGDKSAREGGGKAYKTSDYATKDAREASGKVLDHPSDAETDERRRVFASPSVIDWQEQRRLSVQETKGILGRQ
ncbi:MAG: hypothetical protein QM755_19685 [Luteolibacter sp.]